MGARQLEINTPPILRRIFFRLRFCCEGRIAVYVTEATKSKTDKKTSKVGGLFVSSCLCLCVILSACSSNKLQQTLESKKLKFEQAFAEQCIKKEIRNSVNKDVDRQRFTKPCLCIAKRIVKNLSIREMDKFLLEQKIPHSLTMSFDRAAYFCVQNVTRPKSRFLHGKKQ